MGAGAISSKTIVGVLSILFLAAAIGMWFMGGFVIGTYRRIDTLPSASYTLVPAVVMILIGIIFVFGAVSGFCAACRGKRLCSLLFFLFIFLIFILLFTAIILSFVYRREINDIVEKESKTALDDYGKEGKKAITLQIDYLQQQFKCCGSFNYTFWTNTTFGRNSTVPISCCKSNDEKKCLGGDLNKMDGHPENYINERGCVKEMERFLRGNLYYLGAGAIAFFVLLIFGMAGSCVVLFRRKETSYLNLSN